MNEMRIIIPEWVIAKRRGNRVRYRNRLTAKWGPWVRVWSPFASDGTLRPDLLSEDGFHQIGALNEYEGPEK